MIKLLFVVAILFLVGCSTIEEINPDPKSYRLRTWYRAVDVEEEPCLSEIQYHVPLNFSGELDLKINVSDLCHDFESEEANQERDRINKIFEEHPDDWQDYMVWKFHPKDPVVTIIVDENLTEPKRIDIFEGVRE